MSSANPQGLQTIPRELADPEAWLEPFDWYEEMRESAPVRYDPEREAWDVFRYDDVKAILGDDETFSVDPHNATGFEPPEEPGEGLIFETMLFQDPPRHDELRGVVDEAFRPATIREREPRLRELSAELLDDALAGADDDGDGDAPEIELVGDLAYPFPVVVIAEILGIPADDRDRFREWSETLVTASNAATDADAYQERQQETLQEMGTYFVELLADRRENPREDLLSRIVTAELPDGSTLSRQEALGTCVLLLIAGNITTTNLIGNAVRCFAEHDCVEELTGDRDALSTAVEEVLRYRAPVQAMTRIAREATTVAGETIEAGDRVIVWLGSANRDERQFDDADEFVPDRAPTGHLGFGHGTHYCLGAPLARLEAEVALSELLSRPGTVELVDADLQPTRSSFVYGVESLPIRLARGE